jgi:glycerol-3-phosphate cytidylyltransferase-like family protein
MIAEDFLGNAFVFAERQTGRSAARERHVVEFEERNDVLVESAVVFELVRQVENQVRLKALEFLADEVGIIEYGQVVRDAAQLLQRLEHIGLGLPILRLQFVAEVLIQRRRTNRVEQGEDFQFLLHAIRERFTSSV